MKNKTLKQQKVVDQIIQVLAENQITFSDAPHVLELVNNELDHLCEQQVIRVPN